MRIDQHLLAAIGWGSHRKVQSWNAREVERIGQFVARSLAAKGPWRKKELGKIAATARNTVAPQRFGNEIRRPARCRSKGQPSVAKNARLGGLGEAGAAGTAERLQDVRCGGAA